MKGLILMTTLLLCSAAARAADTDDAALARFMKRSPESVQWAQKRCGDALKPAVAVGDLSRCAKDRLSKLFADSEKVQEEDATAANPYVPNESWNRLNDPGSNREPDDEQDSGSVSSGL
jgi:hypothetical protein